MDQERFRLIVETAEEGIITIDSEARVDFVNPKMVQMIGYTAEEMLGRHLADFFDDEGRRLLEYYLPRRQQGISEQFEYKFVRKDGSDLWVHTSTNPLFDAGGAYVGALAMFTDLTERRQEQRLLAWEKGALEMIVGTASLSDVLKSLVLGLESHLAEGVGSILLLDKDGLHLCHGAAPHLPEAYNRLVDGLAIGPTAGSCGTAAYTRRQVVVSDISGDSLWAEYRSIASQYGLLACWSTPIQNPQGQILGTFAIYYRNPHLPSSWELELVERAVHIAYLAIERKQAEESLRVINQELEDRVAARTRQLRDLTCQLTRTEEHERLRVADVLHEGLLQGLAVVVMGMEGLRNQLSEGPAAGRLKNLRSQLCDIMDLGRTLTYEIYPPALHFSDLGYALECLALRHQDQRGLRVTLECPARFDLQDRALRIFFFRAANELLLNVHRHSQVHQAHLRLSLESGRTVRLLVSDSGCGFNPIDVRAREGLKEGFGLFSLRERAEALGGTFEIKSAPGQGTSIAIAAPQASF